MPHDIDDEVATRRRIEKRLRRQFEQFIALTRCYKTAEGENRAAREDKYRQDFERDLPAMVDRKLRQSRRRLTQSGGFFGEYRGRR